MDNPEYFIDEDIPSLSLVWRPLVSKFSRDPELIYWVPPLYLSGDTLRAKKNTTEILSPTSFGRLRPKHLVSGRWSRKPVHSSRANLLSASEETLYLGWTPKNPINLEGSEHFYEKTPNIFQMHRNPMNFIGLDNHTKRRDSFSYAHNRYKKLESRPSDASDTISRHEEHSNSTHTFEKEDRPEETETNDPKDGVFIIDSGHPNSVFHTTPGKNSGVTVVQWPDDLKDIQYSPGDNRPDIQGWTGTHTYMNDTHLLHKMAARCLTPQTPSGADSQNQCETLNMEDSRSNEESSQNPNVKENAYIVLNTRLYIISVFMIILVGVFLTTVILQTQDNQR